MRNAPVSWADRTEARTFSLSFELSIGGGRLLCCVAYQLRSPADLGRASRRSCDEARPKSDPARRPLQLAPHRWWLMSSMVARSSWKLTFTQT